MADILSVYDKLQRNGIEFYRWNLGEDKAATICIDERYGIFMNYGNICSSAEEMVVVAHEGGHIFTGRLHRVNSPYEIVAQHENRADKWAIEELIGEEELNAAVEEGHTEIWDLAEYFGVTEDFMRKAVCWYKNGNLAVDAYF